MEADYSLKKKGRFQKKREGKENEKKPFFTASFFLRARIVMVWCGIEYTARVTFVLKSRVMPYVYNNLISRFGHCPLMSFLLMSCICHEA